ncbi:unnamed protein product, partial [Mesorhabditis belari]|uniref:C2H2-type domain-containing protein n=1 Tax=Mesorhabditis belari TaxID=2138241 RepID=A0AAF3FDU1_9BILA
MDNLIGIHAIGPITDRNRQQVAVRRRTRRQEVIDNREPGPKCLHCDKTIQLAISKGPAKVRHLMQHARWALNIFPFSCSVCGFANKSPTPIKAHIKKEHNDVGAIIDKTLDEPYLAMTIEMTKKYFPDFIPMIDRYHEICVNNRTSGFKRSSIIQPKRQTNQTLSAPEVSSSRSQSQFDEWSDFDFSGIGSLNGFETTNEELFQEPMPSDVSDFPTTSSAFAVEDSDLPAGAPELLQSILGVTREQSDMNITKVDPILMPQPDVQMITSSSYEAKTFKLPIQASQSPRDSQKDEIVMLKQEIERMRRENLRVSLLLGQSQAKKSLYKTENKALKNELAALRKEMARVVQID